MDHKVLIEKFFRAFAEGDYEAMADCYHKDIVFKDPAFGRLYGAKVIHMWRMLLTAPGSEFKLTYSEIEADEHRGKAKWEANYLFGPDKRKVRNTVNSSFSFWEGKIITHTDRFDFWTWSRQALGLKGSLLGWTSYMRTQVQKQARQRLVHFISQS